MTCKSCLSLLDRYERVVKVYAEACHKLSGMLGEDYLLAFEKTRRLHAAYQAASRQLTEHWTTQHTNLALAHRPRR